MARRRKSGAGGARPRRRKRPTWLKIAYTAMAAVVALAVFAALKKTIRPVLLCYREWTEVQRQEDKLDTLKRENRDLRKKRDYLRSRPGAEAEARKIGYVRPGEISVVIQTEEQTEDPAISGGGEQPVGPADDDSGF